MLLLKSFSPTCCHNMPKEEKIVVVAGHFDPISLLHVTHIRKAREKGDWLIVGIYSDYYIKTYLKRLINEPYEVRRNRMLSFKFVDEIFTFNDEDGTAINLLKLVQLVYPGSQIFFITSNKDTLPEIQVPGIKFLNIA